MTPCTHPSCQHPAAWSFDGRPVCSAHAVDLAARGRPGRLLPRPCPVAAARAWLAEHPGDAAAPVVEGLLAEIRRRETGQGGATAAVDGAVRLGACS
jgi:hypothetical protein